MPTKWMKVCGITLLAFLFAQNLFARASNKNLDKWIGNYRYEEALVTAAGEAPMIMIWNLTISIVNNHYQGSVEVSGQTTYFVYQTTVDGDAGSINFRFNKQTDGPVYGHNNPVKGELLFTLKKVNGKLITQWARLTPQLTEKWPKECSCFFWDKK